MQEIYREIYPKSCKCLGIKVTKPVKFFIGNPSQNYGVSLVIWDHTMLLATNEHIPP